MKFRNKQEKCTTTNESKETEKRQTVRISGRQTALGVDNRRNAPQPRLAGSTARGARKIVVTRARFGEKANRREPGMKVVKRWFLA